MNASHNSGLFIRLTSYSLIYLVGIYPVSTSFANALVPDNNQTQVHSSNGVPVINIATPNGAGVSHNTYRDFNIGKEGAVLNNATAAVQSQLAGQLQKNSNLTDRAANLIVNEVTGSNASRLQGMLEVAGNKASMMVANPNGITCTDCGFINIADATLTTGKPMFDTQGALDALQVVSNKALHIDRLKGKGADAVKLAGRGHSQIRNIEANDLSIITGANKISYKDGAIVAIPGIENPQFAGEIHNGMYANRIRFIATDNAALHLRNLESTVDDISIESPYTVSLFGKIKAKRDLNAKSPYYIRVSNLVSADPNNANLEAGRDVNFIGALHNDSKTIKANRNINITGSLISNRNNRHKVNTLMQAGDNITIQRNSQGDKVQHVINRGGTMKTLRGDITIHANTFVNSNYSDSDLQGYIESANNILINSDEFENGISKIKSNNNLTLTGNKLNYFWQVDSSLLDKIKSNVNSILPSLSAGNSLVANFKNRININLDEKYQVSQKISEEAIISGNTVLLSSDDIYISNKIIADKDIVVNAKRNLNLVNEDLKSKQGSVLLGKDYASITVSDNDKTKVNFIKNVPVINIAPPNSSGISHNTYKNFHINNEGIVLNNSLNNTHSQLVGKLEGNPNLSNQSSRLIINEVTSGNRSNLMGQLEVAGDKSSVMIANPNGFLCNGCGFINTDQAVITTGKLDFDEKGALNFLNVTTGDINVLQNGLNGKETNDLEIISNSLSLHGKITANNISLTQGSNRINYKNGTITTEIEPSLNETININSSDNGAIQANKINILSTGGDLLLNVLESTKEDITITGSNSITINGDIKSSGNINVVTDGDINIYKGAIYNRSGDINLTSKLGEINNERDIKSEGNIRIHSPKIINFGAIKSKNNIWIQKNTQGEKSDEIKNYRNSIKTILGDLIIRAKEFHNEYGIEYSRKPPSNFIFGNIESGKDLYIDSDKLTNNKSQISAVNNVILTGKALKNSNKLAIENGWHFPHEGRSGSITAGNTLEANFSDSITINSDKSGDNVSEISGDKILLKSNKINVYDFNKINAKKELTLIENGVVKLPKDIVYEGDPLIVPDNTKTGVKIINNIPVVNIASPNPSGISHNTYQNFNINKEGVVLNNTLSDIHSQLVGKLERNPNLSNQSSRLIINEVTSGNRSNLMGQLEIAGEKASVMIANPNGIICDGCGFINTDQAVIATGKPDFDEKGALESIKTNVGNIDILSSGLNGKETSSLDIISSSLLLNGRITAKDISLTQGSNDINYKNGTITKTKSPYNVFFGRILSDKAGGIHADKISILSNGSYDVTLGNLETTKGGIEINGGNSIKLNGNIKSIGNINVAANGSVSIDDNTNIHSVNGDVNLFSARYGMIEKYIDGNKMYEQGGIYNNGNIKSGGDIRILSEKFTNTEKGIVQAKNNMWIQKNIKGDKSYQVENEGGVIKTLLGNLIIRAKKLHNMTVSNKSGGFIYSNIESGDNLYINGDDISNSSNIKSVNNLILTGSSLSTYPSGMESGLHSGYITAGNDLVADFKDSIDLKTNSAKNDIFIKGGSVLLKSDKVYMRNINAIDARNDFTLTANKSLYLEPYRPLNLSTKNSISIISPQKIDLYHGLLSSDSISLISPSDINLYSTKLFGKNLNLISKEGNVTIKNDEGFISRLVAENDLNIFSGNNLNIENVLFGKSNNVSFVANNNINVEGEYLEFLSTDSENRNVLDTKNSLTMTSGNNLIIKGMSFNCRDFSVNNSEICSSASLNPNHSINLQAGGDIKLLYLKPSYIIGGTEYPVNPDNYVSRLSVRMGGGNVIINAGRDLELQATNIYSQGNMALFAGNSLSLPAYSYSKPASDGKGTESGYIPTQLKSGKNMTLISHGGIDTEGSHLSTKEGNISLNALKDIRLNAISLVEEYNHNRQKFKSVEYTGTRLSSHGLLTILTNGSLLFQASELLVKGLGYGWNSAAEINAELKDSMRSGTMDIAAKGGYLYAQALEEGGSNEKKGGSEQWHHQWKKNKVTEFSAPTGYINLLSRDDSTFEASKIEFGKNAKLTSLEGKVNFKAVKRTMFFQNLSQSSSWFFFTDYNDSGYFSEMWILPQVTGGKLTVNAAKGINADIKIKNEQSLQNAIDILGNTPGTTWIKDISKRNDVQWNTVQDAYHSWDYSVQRLSPVGAALITIVVSAVTAGKGAPFVAKIAGGSAVAQGALTAGMSALSSKAAVSVINNQGNLSKVFKELGSSDSVKSIITSMTIGGALAGFDQYMGWGKDGTTGIGGTIDPSKAKLPILVKDDWIKVAQRVSGQSLIKSSINTAINGGSFADNFTNALLSTTSNQIHAEGAHWIGKNGQLLEAPGKLLSHSALAALTAEIRGGDAKGAAAGALAAELAAITLEDTFNDPHNDPDNLIGAGKIIGGIAGALVSGTAEGVNSGANAGELAIKYNNYGGVLTRFCAVAAPCRTQIAKELLEQGAKVGITGFAAKEIADNISADDLNHLMTLSLMGNREVVQRYLIHLQDKYDPITSKAPNLGGRLTPDEKIDLGGGAGTPSGWEPDDNENVRSQTSNNRTEELSQLFSYNHPRSGIQIGNRTLLELPNKGGARLFGSASEAEIRQYFMELTGVRQLPAPRKVLDKGLNYSVTTPRGTFNLRNFSSSSDKTGTSWTIDVPRGIAKPNARVEIKFLK